MSATRREFTITCLRRNEQGHWTARITLAGQTIGVDRVTGSWRVPLAEGYARELLLPYATALQKRVKRLERRAAA